MTSVVSEPSPFRPRHLSPSSASTFRQCPRRWKLKYIEKLPDPKGEAAVLGTFVHQILEELLSLASDKRSIDAARNIARDLWGRLLDDEDFRGLSLSDTDAKGFMWKAWRLIEQYFAIEDPTQVNVVRAEQQLAVEIGGVPFFGIVDLTEQVSDGVRVVDYKTGKAPNSRFVDDKLSQVWLYAAALAEEDVEVSGVRLMYLTSGTIDRPIDSTAVTQAVDAHRQTWDDLCEAIDAQKFPHKTGPLCNWCPYLDHCPEGALEAERRYGPRN
ncbi:MAG: PD-(D/E)XK nuclease family protein [Actinomycetota bacterium]|nr:PD-(D/E)XK nuclease family protein [Actinomycetota bacterium]